MRKSSGSATSTVLFYTYGLAYFNSSGLLTSTDKTGDPINYMNYIMTKNNFGVPTWSNVIEGGSF